VTWSGAEPAIRNDNVRNVHLSSIRAAHPVDARGIQRLGTAVFGTHWKNHFPDGARHLEALIGSDGWAFSVAVSPGGRPVGVAVVQPANDEQGRPQPAGIWGELLFLAVADDQRRTGLGAALLRVAEERYAAAGYLGLMATLRPKLVEWYTARGWTTFPVGQVLAYADVRRGNAATAAGGPEIFYWTTPVVREYPVWAWRPLDPERPVVAWAVHPDRRKPRGQAAGRIAAELARQASFGLGRLPEDLRAFAARTSLVEAAGRAPGTGHPATGRLGT
jgi:GNAT superfamily N-acetyltransferase